MNLIIETIPLNWEPFESSSKIYCNENLKRHYDIFSHSENILNNNPNKNQLVDALTSLKRCVSFRINELNKLYSLRRIPVKNKPKNLYDILCFLKIIRPIMLNNLIEIRNSVEHEDKPPPNKNRCKEFLEFTWYFLKSTDRLITNVRTDFSFSEGEKWNEKYWIEFQIEPYKEWKLKARGWIYQSLIIDEFKDYSKNISIKTSKFETFKESLKRLSNDKFINNEELRDPNDIYFDGAVVGTEEGIKLILEKYFSIP